MKRFYLVVRQPNNYLVPECLQQVTAMAVQRVGGDVYYITAYDRFVQMSTMIRAGTLNGWLQAMEGDDKWQCQDDREAICRRFKHHTILKRTYEARGESKPRRL